jgi:hypothetical protein
MKVHHVAMVKPARQGFQVTVLRSMHGCGLIDLDHQAAGKRTYRVALAVDADQLPTEWFLPIPGMGQESTSEPVTPSEPAQPDAPTPEPDVPASSVEAQPAEWPSAPDPLDYNALATALLQKVVEVATAQPDTNGYDRSVALSAQLEYVHSQLDKARQRVMVLERDCAVKDATMKVLRLDASEERRLRVGVERNMQVVVQRLQTLGVDAYSLDHASQVALDKLMRQLPVGPSSHVSDD